MNTNYRNMWMMLFVMVAFLVSTGNGWAGTDSLPDLTELSIEELANIEVISVSRTPRKQSQSAAAIFVVTAEDIRRSGVTSLPEALRMVPGLQVSRISSSKWAVSSRGFNSRYSNKLLVLMDGRTLYLPLFSGVFWENQDFFPEDIERIEVIRGPGASLWGANAVNGVINIITKHSKDTRGSLFSAGAGSYEQGFGRARFGETLGGKGFFRAYASYFSRDEMVNELGNGLDDSWDKYQTGFRSDVTLTDQTDLTIQGDYYTGSLNELSSMPSLTPPTYTDSFDSENKISGYNLLSRLTQRMDGGSEMALQVYLDSTNKEEGGVDMSDDILDLDFQFRMPPLGAHDVMWGLGYRFYTDSIDFPSMGIAFNTPKRDDSLYSSFVQDTITVNDRVQLILGTRIEHNEYSGFEFQPNARVSWEASENNLLWGAVSRAVRTPSRGDTDIRYTQQVIPPVAPNPFPVAVTVWGLDSYDSENLTAFELGHRIKALDNFSLDSTAFYYMYDHLSTYTMDTPEQRLTETPPYILQRLSVGNLMDAKTWGFEMSANLQLFDFLRLQGSYAYINLDFELKADPNLVHSVYSKEDSPEHQVSLRTFIDLPWKTECDIWLRYVDAIKSGQIDSYTEMDLRLGWKPIRNLELSICGQNLLHKQHAEYEETYVLSRPAEVPRSVYGKVTLRF